MNTRLITKNYPYLIIILLLFPALLINLGVMPLSPDEALRALVALEMKFSGNLITPTINGEYYFNKPPLYNWFLLGLYNLTGSQSEFLIRLPVVIFLLIFAFLIYFGIKNYTEKRVAFVSAFAFITAGRILFYDSMLGLIDMSFSLIVFLNFLLIFHFLRKEKFRQLFMVSYFLAGVCFLMKGLPAIVFQGLTIVTAFFFFRQQQKLISFWHLGGILIFLAITSSYYLTVWIENPTGQYFQTLFSESSKRTFIEYGFKETALHLITFPIEQLYHLFPWSLLFIWLFDKRFYRNVRKNPFLSYLALIFIVNIPVYWLSPETYPRYLFMLYPVMMILLINHHLGSTVKERKTGRIVNTGFLIALIMVIPAIVTGRLYYPFDGNKPEWGILSIFLAALIVLIFLFRKLRKRQPEIIIISLLILRIGFNLFVIPERWSSSRIVSQKEQAIQVAEISRGMELKLMPWTGISQETSFYISREREEILSITQKPPVPGKYYISSDKDPLKENEILICRFETRWQNRPLRLVEFTK